MSGEPRIQEYDALIPDLLNKKPPFGGLLEHWHFSQPHAKITHDGEAVWCTGTQTLQLRTGTSELEVTIRASFSPATDDTPAKIIYELYGEGEYEPVEQPKEP